MSVRLLVLADTHMPRRARQLPPPVLEHLLRVDMVVHLGDFTEMDLVQQLQEYAPLYAVHGNNDSQEIRARFPAVQRLDVQSHRVVLIHGDVGGRTALAAARQVENADVVLFGHSHRAWCATENGTLLLNPGSPTDRRFAPYPSFGILDIGCVITPRLISL